MTKAWPLTFNISSGHPADEAHPNQSEVRNDINVQNYIFESQIWIWLWTPNWSWMLLVSVFIADWKVNIIQIICWITRLTNIVIITFVN